MRSYLVKLFFVLVIFAPFGVRADSSMKRIFYFRDGENARQSLYNHYQSIDILAPQFYAFNSSGALESKLNTDVISFALAHGVKVMPLITNKAFSKKALTILDDKVAVSSAITSLISEAKNRGYMGYQIDFEQMDLSYKDKFSSFVERLHQALHDSGLILSVAVVAKTTDDPSAYKKDLYQNLIGAYDYTALSASSDFVSVMSYDDPGSKGPVTRFSWLQDVLGYSLRHIPREKISLGIPLYYWKWNDDTSKLVGIGGYEGLRTAFSRPGVALGHSPVERSAFLRYIDKSHTYTVWYEDGESIKDKINLIKQNNLNGFSAWALGLEVPDVFTAFN